MAADFIDFAPKTATDLQEDHGRAKIPARPTQKGAAMLKNRPVRHVSQITILLLSVMAFAAESRAAGTPEQRRACRADAFRVCRDAIPNVARVTACMQKNIAKLSPPCRAQFR